MLINMICSVSKKWPLVAVKIDTAIKHIVKLMGMDGTIFETFETEENCPISKD